MNNFFSFYFEIKSTLRFYDEQIHCTLCFIPHFIIMYVFISCKLDLDDLSLFIGMKETAADHLKSKKKELIEKNWHAHRQGNVVCHKNHYLCVHCNTSQWIISCEYLNEHLSRRKIRGVHIAQASSTKAHEHTHTHTQTVSSAIKAKMMTLTTSVDKSFYENCEARALMAPLTAPN